MLNSRLLFFQSSNEDYVKAFRKTFRAYASVGSLYPYDPNKALCSATCDEEGNVNWDLATLNTTLSELGERDIYIYNMG